MFEEVEEIKVKNIKTLDVSKIEFGKCKNGKFKFSKMYHAKEEVIFALDKSLVPFGCSFMYNKHTLDLDLDDEKIINNLVKIDEEAIKFLYKNFKDLFSGFSKQVEPEDIPEIFIKSVKKSEYRKPFLKVKLPCFGGEFKTDINVLDLTTGDVKQIETNEEKLQVLKSLSTGEQEMVTAICVCNGIYVSELNGRIISGLTFNCLDLTIHREKEIENNTSTSVPDFSSDDDSEIEDI
jgi:hypothetical protein